MYHKKKRYTSDLTDEEWKIVKPLLPLERKGRGRPIELDMREVVNGILYLVRTGCQWKNLPKDFPNHNSVYYHFPNGAWTGLGDRSTPSCASWTAGNEAVTKTQRPE